MLGSVEADTAEIKIDVPDAAGYIRVHENAVQDAIGYIPVQENDVNGIDSIERSEVDCEMPLPPSTTPAPALAIDPYNRENIPFYVSALPAIVTAGADYFGLGSITPILPYYVQSMSAENEWVGYITTAQFLGVLIGGLCLGRLADVWGLKKTILLIMAGNTIFFALTSYCSTPQLLLACRFVCGFFTPLVSTISWILNASDQRPGATKNTVGFNIGVWGFMMSASYMFGSAWAGIMGPTRWKVVHLVCGALCLCSGLYMACIKAPPRADKLLKPEGLDVILKQREFLGLMLVNLAIGSTWTGGTVAVSIVLQTQLQATPGQLALYFVVVAALHGCVNFAVLPWSIKRFGGPWEAMAGAVVVASASSILLCFNFAYKDLVSLCVMLGVSTLSTPVVLTSCSIMAGAYAAKYTTNARSIVIGISRFGFNVGQVIGPIIAVGLLKISNSAQFAGMTLFVSLCWVLWYFLHHSVEGAGLPAKSLTPIPASASGKSDEGAEVELQSMAVVH
jgi:MFS family permease